MNAIAIINICLGALLCLCYSYQFIYLVISYTHRPKAPNEYKYNRIAVLICARNEERVIARLIDRLGEQDYPDGQYSIFVAADNCTDGTADKARRAGATVYERFNADEIGKGYALDFLIRCIRRDHGDGAFDGYLVLDADNLPEKSYLTEINKTFSQGYEVVTSYRAPMNYSDSWIAAGQSMCFLRDTVILNRARDAVGSFSFISGTGFIFSEELCREFGGGWPFHTMTEDCEFSAYNAVRGSKMGFCDTAIFYDEQPTCWKQSYRQRLRWCRGGIQVFSKYFGQLFRGLVKGRFLHCFDMLMCLAPAYMITTAAVAANLIAIPVSLAMGEQPWSVLLPPILSLGGAMLLLMVFGICIAISERKVLNTGPVKRIIYVLTFPLYMATFIPIAIVAIFKKNVKWKPIERKDSED